MKTNEVQVHNNKRPNIYVEKTVSIFNKIKWDENCLVGAKPFPPNRQYNLLNHYVPTNSSMFQVRDDKHLIFHFQSLSCDVALCLQINQLMIKHLTPLAWLKFTIYVYLCCHVVETNNLICYLICTTCMSTLKNERSNTKQFHRHLDLE